MKLREKLWKAETFEELYKFAYEEQASKGFNIALCRGQADAMSKFIALVPEQPKHDQSLPRGMHIAQVYACRFLHIMQRETGNKNLAVRLEFSARGLQRYRHTIQYDGTRFWILSSSGVLWYAKNPISKQQVDCPEVRAVTQVIKDSLYRYSSWTYHYGEPPIVYSNTMRTVVKDLAPKKKLDKPGDFEQMYVSIAR